MNKFDDSIVRFTQDAVRDNRLKNVNQVRLAKKHRLNNLAGILAAIMGAISLVIIFSWYEIGWPVRAIGIVAAISVALFALGDDGEE